MEEGLLLDLNIVPLAAFCHPQPVKIIALVVAELSL